jgi:hypothetical protein
MKINVMRGVPESSFQAVESLLEPAPKLESACRQQGPSDSARSVFAGDFMLNRSVIR